MRYILIVALIWAPFVGHGQIITLFAGNGTGFYSKDSIPALDEGIYDPNGGAFDKDGSYYFTLDLGANRVCKIDTLGIITTVAGTGTGGYSGDGGLAELATLNGPGSVAISNNGDVYISDYQNFVIRKVDHITNIISTVVGTGKSGYSGDGGKADSAMIFGAMSICFDHNGNLYFPDAYNYRVRKVDTNGIITTIAGTGGFGDIGDDSLAIKATFELPAGIAIDDTGNIYISDISVAVIRKIDTNGIIKRFAGNGVASYIKDNIPALDASIVPALMVPDQNGNLFVSDYYNYRVYKIDSAGILHNVAGNGVEGFSGMGGPATDAELDYPSGLALDKCGNLYIGIVDSNRICKVSFNPTCIPEVVQEVRATDNICIHPNPTNNEVIIEDGENISNVTIANMIGQIVYSGRYNQKKVQVDVSGLPAGFYVVRVNNTYVRKIIKQ